MEPSRQPITVTAPVVAANIRLACRKNGQPAANLAFESKAGYKEAQARLPDLIHGLTSGEEVVLTENDRPVARILPAAEQPKRPPRRLGTLRGTVLYMAPDFDAPLEDFKEYME